MGVTDASSEIDYMSVGCWIQLLSDSRTAHISSSHSILASLIMFRHRSSISGDTASKYHKGKSGTNHIGKILLNWILIELLNAQCIDYQALKFIGGNAVLQFMIHSYSKDPLKVFESIE